MARASSHGRLRQFCKTLLHQGEFYSSAISGSPFGRDFGGLVGKPLQPQAVHVRSYSSAQPKVGLKYYKPTTPGFRGRVITTRENLWRGGPFKPLSHGMAKTGGRNNSGTVTAWHRGGGARKIYRMIDFTRDPAEKGAGIVERVEYDPNRTARIALVKHPDVLQRNPLAKAQDIFSYILAPQDLGPGDAVLSGPEVPIKTGNTLPLSAIPLGTTIHNVELLPGKGGQMARSAGTSCTLIKRGSGHDAYAVIKLPSGEQRSVLARCSATIGVLSNPQHRNTKLGKAGASRWKGRRPVVRGVAMNSVDHPHGGGRGKSKGRISVSPWGKHTKGMKTRQPNKRTNRFIDLSRHKIKSIAVEKRR